MSYETLATARFIDTDFGTWYKQELVVARNVLPETLNGFADMEVPRYEQALAAAMTSCHEPRNAYHGLTHSQRSTENAADGYDGLQRLKGWKIPAGFLQPALLGTAMHDHGHPGVTFFADAAPGRIPKGASPGMAVERYSAEQAALFVGRYNGTPEQQAVAAYVPAASAYGAHEPRGQYLQLERAANPKGISGLMMRAVDVLPAGSDFTISNNEDMAVLYGEAPAGKQPPRTLEEYYKNRIGFLNGYVLPTFDKLDGAAKASLTSYMGWRGRAERALEKIEAIRNGKAVLSAILHSTVQARYGKTLVKQEV